MGISSKTGVVAGIPDDALVDILSRLSAKFLCRSKCVSKPWCNLIADHLRCRKLPHTLEGFFYGIDDLCSRSIDSSEDDDKGAGEDDKEGASKDEDEDGSKDDVDEDSSDSSEDEDDISNYYYWVLRHVMTGLDDSSEDEDEDEDEAAVRTRTRTRTKAAVRMMRKVLARTMNKSVTTRTKAAVRATRKTPASTYENFFSSGKVVYGHFINLLGRSAPLVDPSFSSLRKQSEIMNLTLFDSCNGLLLFGNTEYYLVGATITYAVYNPATEHWVPVPSFSFTSDPLNSDEDREDDIVGEARLSAHLIFDPVISPHFQLIEFGHRTKPNGPCIFKMHGHLLHIHLHAPLCICTCTLCWTV
ncbi:hypothetical protein BAE44_0002027 [Dichanthelium oligosanthes]|uniref:F-box domain-containing protein n=1 Tax=Dichanthelium oligosanthes TaxID=888268 RepID=A0A1E5WHZ6_9POAL|nr:hypothetical protein BAE44_0002027 [Dichanthelium oligosanthes]